jgi:hypothetical protein
VPDDFGSPQHEALSPPPAKSKSSPTADRERGQAHEGRRAAAGYTTDPLYARLMAGDDPPPTTILGSQQVRIVHATYDERT